MAQTHTKLTISFPSELADNITRLSSSLGVSRSAFLTTLLEGPISDLSSLLLTLEQAPDDEVLRAYRGRSVEIIQQRVSDFQRHLDSVEGGQSDSKLDK